MKFRRRVMLLLFAGWTSPGRADFAVMDSWMNGSGTGGLSTNGNLFPNWRSVYAGSFDIWLTDGSGDASGTGTERITALTVVNFGTAGSGDLTNVQFKIRCSSQAGVLTPMTYAGVYLEDTGSYPAWTWAGSSVDLNGCADLCGTPPCGGYFSIDIYVDITPCPTDQATVNMGFPTHLAYDPVWWGSIYDNQGSVVPWYDMWNNDSPLVINYVLKDGPGYAAPGDTITYTVFYGRTGASPLTNIVITDTMPPYTHYVTGSAAPGADAGWDPDWGPPARLRWTLPGGAVTGGPTSFLTFSLTVDWGNGEVFEPGSGDVAAPENLRLDNRAAVNWIGTTCAAQTRSSLPARTTVRRYLFWMLGDNDILFAGKVGLPDDEMIYSIFVKNMSASKTWWDAQIWDTVPAELDPWSGGYGFDDPCAGWTMTPSGCAAASPGRIVAGATTKLTWKLDMPPDMTLTLRWKARVRQTVTAGATASNHVSILELGRAGIVDGTGFAGTPREFIQDALIILRTTYFAYGAYGYQCTGSQKSTTGEAFHAHFFPLNKMTNFALYKQEHVDDVYANDGGVSPPIAVFAGTCVGGFADGGWPGCKVERAPACYWPVAYDNTFPVGGVYPVHFLYKVVSNAPFAWELLNNSTDNTEDRWGFAPGSSLTFSARIHYAFMQITFPGGVQADEFFAINPSDTTATTEFLFRWNPVSLDWDFMATGELDPGTIWRNDTAYSFNQGTPAYVWDEQAYRLVSSTTNTLVWRELWANGDSVRGLMAPTSETGLLASDTATPGTFYCFPFRQNLDNCDANIAVTNIGAVNCKYQMERYDPVGSMYATAPSGSWTNIETNTVPAGAANVLNPQVYGNGYINTVLPTTFGNPTPHWFVRVIQLTTGANLEVMAGVDLTGAYSSDGILNDVTGKKSGNNFWYPQTQGTFTASKACLGTNINENYSLDVFCPAKGMAPRLQSYQYLPGYDATYTTNGPDECVSFRMLTGFTTDFKRNWRVLVGGTPEDAVVQFISVEITEKYYTMPFVSQGTFYTIIAPPVVFTGQSFWLTVIVTTQGGNTKLDYCGTSSFSSTDPSAKMENAPMDGYNFTWSSAAGGCGSSPFNNGVRVFINVTFNVLGLQTLVANDTTDGSITGLTTIMVVGADVKLTKEPRLTVGASGDTVQFRICWSNYSSASAMTFVITDAIPRGTAFVPEAGTAAFNCGNTLGLAAAVAYSTATSTTPPAAFTEANPVAGTRWLRWTLPMAGVNTTGCICYRVTVN